VSEQNNAQRRQHAQWHQKSHDVGTAGEVGHLCTWDYTDVFAYIYIALSHVGHRCVCEKWACALIFHGGCMVKYMGKKKNKYVYNTWKDIDGL